MAFYIYADKCPQNHSCPVIPLCPMNAISQEGEGLPVIDEGTCIECGVCEIACPSGAISKK